MSDVFFKNQMYHFLRKMIFALNEQFFFISDLFCKSPLCKTVFFQSIALNDRNDITFNKISVVLLRHFVLF